MVSPYVLAFIYFSSFKGNYISNLALILWQFYCYRSREHLQEEYDVVELVEELSNLIMFQHPKMGF
jgi:hypothetical protein